MADWSLALARREAVSGLEYVALVVARAADEVRAIHLLLVAASAITLYWVAGQWVSVAALDERHGDGSQASEPLAITALVDPVLGQVGETPIRASDARVQAVLDHGPEAADAPMVEFIRNGSVANVADELALAEAAADLGLDRALDIRAELALAKRRILSSAYLDREIKRRVTPEAVAVAYAAMVDAQELGQEVSLRQILVSSEQEAKDIADKAAKGWSFAHLAARDSIDMETRASGGALGPKRLGDLPEAVADAVRVLPLGEVSPPIAHGQGWLLIQVEWRRAERLPSLEEAQPMIEARLREQVLAETVSAVRGNHDIRVAEDENAVAASVAAISLISAW